MDVCERPQYSLAERKVLAKDLRSETVRRFALSELMISERSRLLADDLVEEVPSSRAILRRSNGLRHLSRCSVKPVRVPPTCAKFLPVTDPAMRRPRCPANQGPPTGRTLPKGKREAAKAKELGPKHTRCSHLPRCVIR